METPVNAPVKEKVRIELANLREMTFKSKLEHIWEYYKFYIIAFVVIIFVLVSLLNIWVFNPNPEQVLFISWNAGFATDEQEDRMREFLEERLIDEGANEEVIISQFFFSSGDPSVDMAGFQRTVAMISAGMIDLFILNEELLNTYTEAEFLQPLDSFLDKIMSINPDAYNRITENVISVLYENDGISEERQMGIKIGSSPLFIRLGMYEQELYVGISITSGKIDNVIKTLIMFFE